MQEILVFDDFIPVRYQNEIETVMLSENNATAWFLQEDISYSKTRTDVKKEKSAIGFSHVFFNERGVVSNLYNFLLPMIYSALEKGNYDLQTVVFARSFLQIPKNKSTPNNPHVDVEFPHLVCLYYVNDSDGDTIIYNERINDIEKTNLHLENLSIFKTVTPKKGRVVLFNGEQYHSSSCPTTGLRCTINFDLLIK